MSKPAVCLKVRPTEGVQIKQTNKQNYFVPIKRKPLCNIWLQEAKKKNFPVWFACYVCYIFRYFATLEKELRSGGAEF